MKKQLLAALTVFVFSAVSWASGSESFTERKGVREFTGTLLVKPAPAELLLRRGVDPRSVSTVKQRAVDRVKSLSIRSDQDLGYYVVKVPTGSNENKLSQSLVATGEYEYAIPNYRLYPVGTKTTPNDPRFPQQWHHKTIHSEEAWTVWRGTSNVTVAVVDTGVKTDHSDLKGGIVKGYNSVDRRAEVDGGDVQDNHGHGTHCAGDAAAQGNNSVGLVGEGWGFKIMPIKAAPQGGASYDDLIDGAKWAVNHGAKVVSVSFSGVDYSIVGDAGTYIKSRGGLLLWAAGNDARDLSMFSYPDTIVVGASDELDHRAGFSAFGRGVAVFAPGTNIWSTTNDGNYAPFSGTSMATPVTNGVCAMIWSINPDLKPAQVQQILYNTCDQIGSASTFGHGRVNLYRAALSAKASLSSIVNYNPTAIKVLQGTYVSGNLNNLINGIAPGYLTKSVTLSSVGQSLVNETSYKLTFPLSKLRSLQPSFTVSDSKGVAATVMIYLFDRVGQKYVQLKSVALPNDGTAMTISASVDSGLESYVAPDGTIRTAVRLLSPLGRRGEADAQFQSIVKVAKLRAEAVFVP